MRPYDRDEGRPAAQDELASPVEMSEPEWRSHLLDPLRSATQEKITALLSARSLLPRDIDSAFEGDTGLVRHVLWEMIVEGAVGIDTDLSLVLKSHPPEPPATETAEFEFGSRAYREERKNNKDDFEADERDEGERDRDRLIYAMGLRRLGAVSQTASSDQGVAFHNRLTHTLVVAQVARRLAEYLDGKPEYRDIVERAGLNPAVAEAAALAHDMGHPPFGHEAEQTLDELMEEQGIVGGFNGNAQSFRIVTYQECRNIMFPGLNLTRATLNAILKYPWLSTAQIRKGDQKYARKWGAFETEWREFEFARAGREPDDETPSLEAEIMDWADDIAYALHDVEDFYRVGLVPLDRLLVDENARASFLSDSFARWARLGIRNEASLVGRGRLEEIFDRLMDIMRLPDLTEPYDGREAQRQGLRAVLTRLTRRYVREPGLELLEDPGPTGCVVVRDSNAVVELFLLKELIWHYVIRNPGAGLISQQVGQKAVIRTLFEEYCKSPDVFPRQFNRIGHQEQSETVRKSRNAVDFICSLTEPQAVALYGRLTGASWGSISDAISST